jgi:hypothetical protein
MTPIRQNELTYITLARGHNATHTTIWIDLYNSCTRPPCHPYAKIDGFIPFLHATTKFSILQNGRTNQNITNSIPPHTPKWMDLYHSCTRSHCRTYAKLDGPIITSLPPYRPIRINGWTYVILARGRITKHTPKLTD